MSVEWQMHYSAIRLSMWFYVDCLLNFVGLGSYDESRVAVEHYYETVKK